MQERHRPGNFDGITTGFGAADDAGGFGGGADVARASSFDVWLEILRRYRHLACRDCHGSGVADGSFRMPNPDLPRLGWRTEGFQELAAREPEVFRFMQRDVVPQTARLLGVPAFDMATHEGFSCFHCHVRKETP